MRAREFSPVLILVVLSIASLLPFCFFEEFGERDGYRMLLGLVDTVANKTFFNSSLLYNREVSFGYYGFLHCLSFLIGSSAQALAAAMNCLGLISNVLFVIPEYVIVKRLLGSRIAITSGIILISTPVWWYSGLYGHPITTAMLLFFSALAILSRYNATPPATIRKTVAALMAAALMFRFDTVLLFVALSGLLLACRQSRREALKEVCVYAGASLAAFVIAHQSLPAVNRGPAPESILGLLARFHDPHLFAASLRESLIMLGEGFTALLLVSFPISAVIVFRKRCIGTLVFVSGVIMTNLIFWTTNPNPPRHYLMMAPAISVSAAIVALKFVSRFGRSSSSPWIAGLVTAMGVLAISEALHHANEPHLSYFRSPFEKRHEIELDVNRADRIAQELISLRRLSTPVVVLCDSNLVIAHMEKRLGSIPVRLIYARRAPTPVGVHTVRSGKNEFIMVEQAWEKEAVEGFDHSGLYAGVPVLTAPYLYQYNGARPRITATGNAAASVASRHVHG